MTTGWLDPAVSPPPPDHTSGADHSVPVLVCLVPHPDYPEIYVDRWDFSSAMWISSREHPGPWMPLPDLPRGQIP